MTTPPTIDPAAVLWSAPPAERAGRPLLVLLHGYGSNERDLFSLTSHLPTEPVIAALRAPLTPPWPGQGYSWYAIEGLNGRDPGALTASAEAVLAWADEHATEAASIAFLGFSQGGAMSLQLLRLAPERVAFAVNLSGYAAGGELPGDEVLAATRPPVFWARGALDEVIPQSAIEHTAAWLPEHSDLSGRIYPGLDHAVSLEVLADLRNFLALRYAPKGS